MSGKKGMGNFKKFFNNYIDVGLWFKNKWGFKYKKGDLKASDLVVLGKGIKVELSQFHWGIKSFKKTEWDVI